MLFLRNHKLDNRLLIRKLMRNSKKKKKKPIIICHYLYALKYGNRSHNMYIRHCKQIAMTRQTQTYIYRLIIFFPFTPILLNNGQIMFSRPLTSNIFFLRPKQTGHCLLWSTGTFSRSRRTVRFLRVTQAWPCFGINWNPPLYNWSESCHPRLED